METPNGAMIPAPIDLKLVPDIMKHPDVRKAILAQLRADNTLSYLANGEVFFVQEGGTTKRAFKTRVALSCPQHFIFIGDKPMMLGEAYDKINQVCGIEIIDANRGKDPYERDKAGRVIGINLHRIGIGYSPTGNLVAVDQTYHADCSTLLIQEIQSKLKKHPFLGMMGTADQKPDSFLYYETRWIDKPKDNGKGTYKYKETAEEPKTRKVPGNLMFFEALEGGRGYWLDVTHPESQGIFESVIQKQRFLERASLTVVKRLILAAHPAIGTKTPIITSTTRIPEGQKNAGDIVKAEGYVVVYGFAMNDDPKKRREEMEAMAARVAEGKAKADVTMHHEGSVEDAEIADPIAAGADPSELPPQEPEEGDDEPRGTIPTVETHQPDNAAPQSTSTPTTKPPQESPSVPTLSPKERFSAIIRDDSPANLEKVEASKAKCGFKTLGEIRSNPDKIVAFLTAFDTEVVK